MTDHLARAKSFMAKAAIAGLAIMPLADATVAHASLVLPTGGSCNSSGGGAQPACNITQLAAYNGITGVEIALNAPFTKHTPDLDFNFFGFAGTANQGLAAGSMFTASWSGTIVGDATPYNTALYISFYDVNVGEYVFDLPNGTLAVGANSGSFTAPTPFAITAGDQLMLFFGAYYYGTSPNVVFQNFVVDYNPVPSVAAAPVPASALLLAAGIGALWRARSRRAG